MMNAVPNPKLPTWEEAMNQVLTAAEKDAFIAHVRPPSSRARRETRRQKGIRGRGAQTPG